MSDYIMVRMTPKLKRRIEIHTSKIEVDMATWMRDIAKKEIESFEGKGKDNDFKQ